VARAIEKPLVMKWGSDGRAKRFFLQAYVYVLLPDACPTLKLSGSSLPISM
jgi:hypothetical protein